MRLIQYGFFVLSTLFVVHCGDTKGLELSNPFLTVEVVPAHGMVSLFGKPSKEPFAVSTSFSGLHDTHRITIHDPVFGDGEALVLSDDKGEMATIKLYRTLPFALFQSVVRGGGSNVAYVMNRVEGPRFQLKFSKPASSLKSFGTGGLLDPASNPGSYAWQSVVDPENKHGVVAGWLTHDRASGLFFTAVSNETQAVDLQPRSDYGRLQLAGHASTASELMAIGWFDDARLGLESWADAVAANYHVKLPERPSGFTTWYTEKHGHSSDQSNLATLAAVAGKQLEPYGFQFIQIDDGWQDGDARGNGPYKNFTRHRADGPYSHGMEAMADDIKAQGLQPGLWFMPFAGTYNDSWFQPHQEWFVKDRNGKPYDNEWGGTSLDMTHPGAQEYARSVVQRISKEWGYHYFKMDGFYTGMATRHRYVSAGYVEDDFGDATFSDSSKTNVEVFRAGVKMIRETAGRETFFLGCTVAQNMRSYGASFGLLDAMRIGPDNDGPWPGWAAASPVYGTRHYFLNGRVWYNDPDPYYVRASLSLDEARTTASWTAISGQLAADSDWIPDLPPDRIAIMQKIMRSHHATARPVDLFEREPARIWTVHDEKALRDLVAVFNWEDKTIDVNLSLDTLGLNTANSYVGFDFWEDQFIPPFLAKLPLQIRQHASRVIALRPLLTRPFLLSTNGHVTQGIVDVEGETWDGAGSRLIGTSRMVAGDSYELRIVTPGEFKSCKAEVTAENSGATITSRVQDDILLRVAIKSTETGKIAWTVAFNCGAPTRAQ